MIISIKNQVNKLPYEISRNIWARYYTFTVLGEFLATKVALEAQVFNCDLAVEYVYLYPDELSRFSANHTYDEYLEFASPSIGDHNKRFMYHGLEVK